MSSKTYRILVVNPGSTSTKVAVFDNDKLLEELTLRHSAEELSAFDGVTDQFAFRRAIILDALANAGIEVSSIDAVIGRGGMLKPLPSGVYEVNDRMKHDLSQCVYGQHASNLGGLIAADIAAEAGSPAYIADPVVVDEMDDVARVTGRPEIERVSIFHALNQKAVAKEYAKSKSVSYDSLNLIVAHLGGGISMGAHRKGRIVDVNNALDGDGPLSPERAGALPAGQLAKLCFSGDYTAEQMRRMITGSGGIVAHLGTNNMIEVVDRASSGDEEARLLIEAMAYNVGKSIGAAAAVLRGQVDAVIITGGIAHDKDICSYIEKMVSFIAPVVVMAGENELEALAANALRVLRGDESPKEYV